MRYFTYKSLTELQQAADRLPAPAVRLEPDRDRVREILARPVEGEGFRLGNSIAIHPMEGCDGTLDGRPEETLTWRRYQRFAAGGAKLLWFEATAVTQQGRANPRQLWITPANVDHYARILEMIRRTHQAHWGTTSDLLEPIQLTHSGRYSVPRRIIAYHHPLIDQKTDTPADYPVISDSELEQLEDQYVAAARLALRAGFRALDIKATHGYLVSELLGAKTRKGCYGGPLENRARFLRNVVRKVRDVAGPGVVLCVRLGVFDGVPHARDPKTGVGYPLPYSLPYNDGFGVDSSDPMREDLSEAKQVIAWLYQDGVRLLNVSMGSPYYNPHIGRPFERPDDGNYESPEHPLLGVDRHFRIAAALQRTFPHLPMVGTGYSWLQRYQVNAAAHNLETGAIRIFGVGRGALAYPDFARHALEKGELDELRVCKTLTYCTFLMRQKNHPLGQFPTGCPPFDKEVYGPIMKQAREAQRAAVARQS